MVDDIKEPEDKRTTLIIHAVGDSMDKFKRGDFPTGNEYTEREKLNMLKEKKAAVVTIEIKATSGGIPFTMLADDFILRLDSETSEDNKVVLQKKLQNLIPQIGVLIDKWTTEMNR